eukprot:33341-Alexandrium_andersonii.AAC.1
MAPGLFPCRRTGPSVKSCCEPLQGASPGGAATPPDTPDWRRRRERPHQGGCPPPQTTEKCHRRTG